MASLANNWLFHCRMADANVTTNYHIHTFIAFVHEDFWSRFHHLSDRDIQPPIPDNCVISLYGASTYESLLHIDEMVSWLLSLGFRRDPDFSRFMLTHTFCEDYFEDVGGWPQ